MPNKNLSKAYTEKVVDIILPCLIKLLGLKKYIITYETMKSTGSKAKKLNLQDSTAAVHLGNGTAHIVIMYDCHEIEEDVLDSVLHELLHVRLQGLRLMTFPDLENLACEEDEIIVQYLTALFMGLYLHD